MYDKFQFRCINAKITDSGGIYMQLCEKKEEAYKLTC